MKVIVLLALMLVCSVNSALSAESKTPRILFDEGHSQKFLIEGKGDLQLSKLADAFRKKGISTVSTDKQLTASSLSGFDALVISGPFSNLSESEIRAVLEFVKNGGSLSLMLHIGPPLSELLEKLGVDHSNSVVREQENVIEGDPINYRVTSIVAHPVLEGLNHYSVYGGWAFNPGPEIVVLAKTGKRSWIDLDGDKKLSKGDALGEFSVLVSGTLGSGKFIIFSDDAIFQNKFMDDSNSKLAENLAAWLTSR